MGLSVGDIGACECSKRGTTFLSLMRLANTPLEGRFELDWSKDVSSSASGIEILAFLCDVAIRLLLLSGLLGCFFGLA